MIDFLIATCLGGLVFVVDRQFFVSRDHWLLARGVLVLLALLVASLLTGADSQDEREIVAIGMMLGCLGPFFVELFVKEHRSRKGHR